MSMGFASCMGGQYPDPPIHDYPLLAWSNGVVHTEDRQATVDELASAGTSSIVELAAYFCTTPEHVRQALDYARAAGQKG